MVQTSSILTILELLRERDDVEIEEAEFTLVPVNTTTSQIKYIDTV